MLNHVNKFDISELRRHLFSPAPLGLLDFATQQNVWREKLGHKKGINCSVITINTGKKMLVQCFVYTCRWFMKSFVFRRKARVTVTIVISLGAFTVVSALIKLVSDRH